MAGVPSNVKLPRLDKKRVMKEAMRDLLPPEIIRKKKVGLEMPYSSWFRNELKGDLEACLSPERLAATGLFSPQAVTTLMDEHQRGVADHGRALWGLVNYVNWYDLYIDRAAV
jgi:asparagine synthase (glutamine-hydrolysing)